MFGEITNHRNQRHRAILASLSLHCAVVWLVLWALRPNFIRISSVALGDHGAKSSLVYLSAREYKALTSTRAKTASKKLRNKRKSLEVPLHPAPEQTTEQAETQAPPAGSAFGSQSFASASGVEARPALPLVFPDPPRVSRSELPSSQGDVIVEITIDAQGNVTGMKVLQSLGTAVDSKVLAVLHDWRFTPATVDGVPTPSRQDVYFHFPNS
jgi:TonB family protein